MILTKLKRHLPARSLTSPSTTTAPGKFGIELCHFSRKKPSMLTPRMADEDFRYSQLDTTKQQIRLVLIRPQPLDREYIECTMHVFNVKIAPHYVTLSYTLGPPTPTNPILLNGKRFLVRQNLYDFLGSHERDSSNYLFIWIDQICISQAHAGERNHQVRLMSQIYSRCMYVIIWIGEANTADQRADKNIGNAATKLDLESALRIARCMYFCRLWVIQEIFLPPGVRVLFGGV